MSEAESKFKYFTSLTKKGLPEDGAKLLAGYGPDTNPKKPSKAIVKALDDAGVTDKLVADTTAEGLKAQNRFGSPDHNSRTKYLALVAKWKGYDRDDPIAIAIGLNISGTSADIEKVKEAITVIDAEIIEREDKESEDGGPEKSQETSDPETSSR